MTTADRHELQPDDGRQWSSRRPPHHSFHRPANDGEAKSMMPRWRLKRGAQDAGPFADLPPVIGGEFQIGPEQSPASSTSTFRWPPSWGSVLHDDGGSCAVQWYWLSRGWSGTCEREPMDVPGDHPCVDSQFLAGPIHGQRLPATLVFTNYKGRTYTASESSR